MLKPWEGALWPYHTKKVLLVFNIAKILRSGYPGPLQSSTVLMKAASSGMQPGTPAGGQWTGGLLRSWACSPGTAEQTWGSTPPTSPQRQPDITDNFSLQIFFVKKKMIPSCFIPLKRDIARHAPPPRLFSSRDGRKIPATRPQ